MIRKDELPANGILVADKQPGCTSHDVVLLARRRLATTKAGHLGTLDPMATGCLPLCLGRATRLSPWMSSGPKHYVGTFRLGLVTDSYDVSGRVISEQRDVRVDDAELGRSAAVFKGEIEQVPPMFSAKKIGGQPLYKMARRGRTVDVPPERVRIDRFDITGRSGDDASFEIECGPGTYVRALVHDLGRALGCGAAMTSLRRLRSGPFTIDQAVILEQATPERLAAAIIPLSSLLPELPGFAVSGRTRWLVVHGQSILSPAGFQAGLGAFVRVLSTDGEFLALGKVGDEQPEGGLPVLPKVVLSEP